MATYYQLTPFIPQFLDSSGRPMTGGTLNVYLSGTTTESTLYTDDAGTATGTAISLNSRGYPVVSGNIVQLHAKFDVVYKLVLKDSSGAIVYTADEVSGAGALESKLAASTGAAMIGYGETTVAATLPITPEKFGAVGDGVTDDTDALKLAAAVVQAAGGGAVHFMPGKTYLISYTGGYDSVNGYVVFDFSGLRNVSLIGNGCTIKCVNHNITSNGGFRFANFVACVNPLVSGFYFDMSFTGANTSASYYPFCGAVTFIDEPTGTGVTGELNENIVCKDLTFKLYHNKGCWQRSSNAYAGDNNNGYKIFSIFASGDYLSTLYENQNSGFTCHNIKFDVGHNGYGIWSWAYNDVHLTDISSRQWVTKYSDAGGTVGGVGVAMIRYYQWHCTGLTINGVNFRAMPCNDRTTSGFEGGAHCIYLVNNLTGNYTHGMTTITNCNIRLGRGDAANSLNDQGIYASEHYGTVTLSNLAFDSVTTTTNAYDEEHIYLIGGDEGYCSYALSNINFSKNCDYGDNIQVQNVGPSSTTRRIKYLSFSNIVSYGQLSFLIDIKASGSHYGVPVVSMSNITCVGTDNSVYTSASSSSRAFRLSNSATTDMITMSDITVVDKYRVCVTDNIASTTQHFTVDGLKADGITAYWSTAIPVVNIVSTGAPASSSLGANGSRWLNVAGLTGTTLYVKEDSAWVAK